MKCVFALRRHLLTFMTLRQPGALFRLMVLLGQVTPWDVCIQN